MKYDLKKDWDIFKSKNNKDFIKEINEFNAIMISGEGSPGSKYFVKAIENLYLIAYKIKFLYKEKDQDYIVPPLMGFWYADDMSDFLNNNRENWKWDLFIPLPNFVDVNILEDETVKVNIGKVVSTLHIGPYSEEGPIIQRMHKYAFSKGYKLYGKHLEIYVGDPRRSAPEKLKTILAQQIK